MNGQTAHWSGTNVTLNWKHLDNWHETGVLVPRPKPCTFGHKPLCAKWSRLPIFSHLQDTDMSVRGRGQKACTVKQSCHRYVPVTEQRLIDHYLSLCSSRVLKKLLWLSSLERSNLVPKTWLLLLQGIALLLYIIVLIYRGCLSCKGALFLMESFSPFS
jgi:hypothetical protein